MEKQNKDIQFIIQKANAAKIIATDTELHLYGQILIGKCPFHDDDGMSLIVDPKKQSFWCADCGRGGNVIAYLMYKGMTFDKAMAFLADKLGVMFTADRSESVEAEKRLYEVNHAAAEIFQSERSGCADYLKSRNISEETAKSFMLGFAPDTKKVFDGIRKKGFTTFEILRSGLFRWSNKQRQYCCDLEGRVVIPICDADGNILSFGGRILSSDGADAPKYVNGRNTSIYVKGHDLFGINFAPKGKPIVLCEGYFDVISLRQAGFNAVAPLGTALTYYQAELIKRYTDTVYLALDNDPAGVRATFKAITQLEKVGCDVYIVTPDPYKDFDEALKSEKISKTKSRFAKRQLSFDWILKNIDMDNLSDERNLLSLFLNRRA